MNYISVDNQRNIEFIGISLFRYDNIDIYIDGLIFVYGKKAGKESIDWLADTIHKTGNIPFEDLHGSFSCVIKNKKKITMFSDNSNLHCMYYSQENVSNSFLRLVQLEIDAGRELIFDLEAVCEYLSLGNIYFEKTFFHNIHILNSTEIITIDEARIIVSKKPIKDIDGQSQVKSINDFFEKIAYSLSDMSICQALTGGYDSRMVYACLSNKIKDHPAISANDAMNKDVIYAKEVAAANKDELEIVSIKKPVFTESLIYNLFENKDGMVPFDLDGDVRLQMFKTKLAKAYNIHLTGDGGVLHKDWEWTQDLPFYRKRRSNANKFYKQRLYYLSIDSHIGEQLNEVFSRQEKRFVNYLDGIAKQFNTQSYDSWYYRVSGNRRTDYNCNPVPGIISYAPLNEIDIVRYSYALPRYMRFFYNSIRQTMTKENKKIAKIRTNYGTNASSELPYIIIDVFYQAVEYFRKAYRLIGRKLTHRNVMSKSILDWTLENEIRCSSLANEAFRFAQECGFIKANLTMDDVSYSEIQRLIHIYFLKQTITTVQ